MSGYTLTAEPIRLDTAHGPLSLTLYAGPTSNLDTAYARDGGHPDRAHTFGRVPVAPYVGARVRTTDGDTLTVNGVAYTADAGYTLTADGWAEDRGGIYHPLTRAGSFFHEGTPTDGARKTWREAIAPAVIAALSAADLAPVIADARAEYETAVRARVVELRAEADRLSDMLTGWPPIA